MSHYQSTLLLRLLGRPGVATTAILVLGAVSATRLPNQGLPTILRGRWSA